MTVSARINNLGGWTGGWTWFAGAWSTNSGKVPAFEVEWNDDGEAIQTGRRAWLNLDSINNSQLTSDTPSRYEPIPDLGERLLDPEDYMRLIIASDIGAEYRKLDLERSDDR